MSESIVSLIVAVIGAVSGLAGAFIGGRAARQGAEHSVQGMIDQVQEQAKQEHSKWLREQRFASCSRLYGALIEVMRAANALHLGRQEEPFRSEDVPWTHEMGDLVQAVFNARAEVALVSTRDLSDAAGEAGSSAVNLFGVIGTPEWDAGWEAYGQAFHAFRVKAADMIQSDS